MPAIATPARASRDDAGAISIEWAGLLVVSALVVSVVVASVASPRFLQTVSSAVCQIVTVGQGGCETPELAVDRMPTEPCSVSGNGYGISGRLGVTNIAVSGERAILHEELSNGQHRVVVTVASGAGVEAGAGWEARARFTGAGFGDFSDTSWGWDMGADADAMVQGREIHTYLVNSADEADRVVEAALADAAIDLTAGSTTGPFRTVSETVLKPMVNWTRELLGLPTTSHPTSTTYQGGISAQASAWMTPLGISSVEATIGGQAMLGVTMHSDGTYTVHGEATSDTAFTGNFVTLSGSWPPEGGARIDATYSGTELQSISVGTEVGRSTSREYRTWTLPIHDDADLEAASGVLAPFTPAWDRFFSRVDSHGQATRVSYDTSQTAAIEVGASGRLLTGAGVNLGGSLFNEEVASAEYFDGSRWVPWDSCLN